MVGPVSSTTAELYMQVNEHTGWNMQINQYVDALHPPRVSEQFVNDVYSETYTVGKVFPLH